MFKLHRHIEADAEAVSGFLSQRRQEPPERDGWYGGYQISRGIKSDIGHRLRSARVYPAIDALMKAEPPLVEDTWMKVDRDNVPILHEQFTNEDKPMGARRFYRALGSIVNETEVIFSETEIE